jgi:hypothetical protein
MELTMAPPRVSPHEPLNVAGPHARAAVLHRDGREGLVAGCPMPYKDPLVHPSESLAGRLPKPPRRRQDRDGPMPVALGGLSSQAVPLGLGDRFPGVTLGLGRRFRVLGLTLGLLRRRLAGPLLGPALGHRLWPPRGLTPAELGHVLRRLERPKVLGSRSGRAGWP